MLQVPIFASFLAINALATEVNRRRDGLRAIVQALEDWLPEQLVEANVPGAAAAVVDRRGVISENTYGHLDDSDSQSVDPNTLFCVRSLSKSFTALAVLMAAQDGLLELDTPIDAYLPEFRVNSRYDSEPEKLIALRHLLSHHAGFAHDPPQFDESGDQNTFKRHISNIPT